MYIYRDRDHLQKVWRGPIARELGDKFLATQGVRTLNSIWEVGIRHVLAKKPVRQVEDLNGLKIRTPESALFFEGFKALGARPTTIAFAEVYTALQLGTVDAMECPLDWIYTSRFHEVAKNLTLTAHLNNIHSLLVNEKFWQTLSPDIQKVLADAGLEAGEYANLQIKNGEADYRKKMEQAGVTFLAVDTGPFQRKAEEAIPKLAHIWGGDMKLAERVKNTQ
jgi:tripartite ATP-independent transporter DctP family solute receptor